MEQVIMSLETIIQSVGATDNETASEADGDVDSFDEPDIGYIGKKASWSVAVV